MFLSDIIYVVETKFPQIGEASDILGNYASITVGKEKSDMKKMTWDEYYDGFYSWSVKTQQSYSARLNDFGPADEVFEIVSEFALTDKEFAAKFVEKALDAGVRFTPENVLDMAFLIDKPVLSKMAEQTSASFDRNQLEDIYMLIDDTSFAKISKRAKIDIFSDDKLEQDEQYQQQADFRAETSLPQKPGFFTRLLEIMTCEFLFGNFISKHHKGTKR